MPEKISIMNPREKQVYTWFLVVVLVLFCLATYISRFNPLEVLWEQGEFWKFLFQDFLPPRFNASPVVVESILVTFALAFFVTGYWYRCWFYCFADFDLCFYDKSVY